MWHTGNICSNGLTCVYIQWIASIHSRSPGSTPGCSHCLLVMQYETSLHYWYRPTVTYCGLPAWGFWITRNSSKSPTQYQYKLVENTNSCVHVITITCKLRCYMQKINFSALHWTSSQLLSSPMLKPSLSKFELQNPGHWWFLFL